MKNWEYKKAFKRNIGLVTTDEQAILQKSHIAIAGMGGGGGIHLVTLARLGIGNFTIADPDTFGIENTNRQYGAKQSTYGQNKADVMAKTVRDINPTANVNILPNGVTEKNASELLAKADIFIDALDIFNIATRRTLYKLAAQKGIYSISAAPLGFGTGWLIFDPNGMNFDEYFNISPNMNIAQQFISFVIGVAPAGLHLDYIDKKSVNFKNRSAPSLGLATDLAAGVLCAETIKIILKRGSIYPVPYYQQFDVYLNKFIRKRLLMGNKHPKQRLKYRWLMRYAQKHDMLQDI